ncbi:hypothetical protein [Microbispora bryophytorum]|uniref:hypothetical protein n=1 Tax=Microbispora bryophytorum TaxID=1460882 RepID=UPI001159EC0C|nr:hypothetical protein [Microbispora bryophytorum]MBD3135819.1 hypothetical protein [Microbispora bryophytorum]TQS09968.1 hypothetical protein FLX07_02675 [Microbispora bryophytorum]
MAEERFFILESARPDVLRDFQLAALTIDDAIANALSLASDGCHSDGKEGGSDGNETGKESSEKDSEGKESSDPELLSSIDPLVLPGEISAVEQFLRPMM